MSTVNTPPVAKYRLTITVTGNSHDEIEDELVTMVQGGYLSDSEGYKRDEWHVWGGRTTRVMEHTNPEQTPEAYSANLKAWHEARVAARRAAKAQR